MNHFYWNEKRKRQVFINIHALIHYDTNIDELVKSH